MDRSRALVVVSVPLALTVAVTLVILAVKVMDLLAEVLRIR